MQPFFTVTAQDPPGKLKKQKQTQHQGYTWDQLNQTLRTWDKSTSTVYSPPRRFQRPARVDSKTVPEVAKKVIIRQNLWPVARGLIYQKSIRQLILRKILFQYVWWRCSTAAGRILRSRWRFIFTGGRRWQTSSTHVGLGVGQRVIQLRGLVTLGHGATISLSQFPHL